MTQLPRTWAPSLKPHDGRTKLVLWLPHLCHGTHATPTAKLTKKQIVKQITQNTKLRSILDPLHFLTLVPHWHTLVLSALERLRQDLEFESGHRFKLNNGAMQSKGWEQPTCSGCNFWITRFCSGSVWLRCLPRTEAEDVGVFSFGSRTCSCGTGGASWPQEGSLVSV